MIAETIKKDLIKLRQENNLSIRELGERCGVSHNVLYDYELRGITPKVSTIEKIFKAFNKEVRIEVDNITPKSVYEQKYYEIQSLTKKLKDLTNNMEDVGLYDKGIPVKLLNDLLDKILDI